MLPPDRVDEVAIGDFPHEAPGFLLLHGWFDEQ